MNYAWSYHGASEKLPAMTAQENDVFLAIACQIRSESFYVVHGPLREYNVSPVHSNALYTKLISEQQSQRMAT